MRKVIQQNNTRKRYKDSVTYRQRNTETLRDWESKKVKEEPGKVKTIKEQKAMKIRKKGKGNKEKGKEKNKIDDEEVVKEKDRQEKKENKKRLRKRQVKKETDNDNS